MTLPPKQPKSAFFPKLIGKIPSKWLKIGLFSFEIGEKNCIIHTELLRLNQYYKNQWRYYIYDAFKVISTKLDVDLSRFQVIFYPILIQKCRVGNFVQFFYLLNEFSQVYGYLTSVQYHLKLLQQDFQTILSADSKEHKESPNFPHGCGFPPSPKILIFFENLIELKF